MKTIRFSVELALNGIISPCRTDTPNQPKAALEHDGAASYAHRSLMSAEAPVKLTHNEEIKAAIPTLAGTIAATIADEAQDHFSHDDYEFLKFHGCYQQDDRDLRKTGKKYIMMVRSRVPGGVMTASQWKMFRPSVVRLRQQHAAHHDAPDDSISRHPEKQSARRHQRHQRMPALDARGLRRREPQRPCAAHARLHQRARTCLLPTAKRSP